MQPLPLTRREIVDVLAHRVARAEGLGLSREQAVARVSHQLDVDPAKIVALVPPSHREAA